jgi:hypothetical protein
MISVTSDIMVYDISHDDDHDIDHDIDYDIIANPPAMSDSTSHSFGYGIMKDFNVGIPSCTGELGR